MKHLGYKYHMMLGCVELPMKRSRLNRFSPQKIAELNAEAPIRVALCQRAGGTPIQSEIMVYISGKRYTYTKVECYGGKCEHCGCHAVYLEPHEKNPRGRGGKLTLENTIMVTRPCHRLLQGSSPKWFKEVGNAEDRGTQAIDCQNNIH